MWPVPFLETKMGMKPGMSERQPSVGNEGDMAWVSERIWDLHVLFGLRKEAGQRYGQVVEEIGLGRLRGVSGV